MKRTPAGNMVLPKAGLNGFDWAFVQGSTAVILLNFSAKIPAFGNTRTVTGNRMTRQLKQFSGVTIETLNDCPLRLFSQDNNFIFQFCTSYLVQFRGTVIQCLTDFVNGTDRQVIRPTVTI